MKKVQFVCKCKSHDVYKKKKPTGGQEERKRIRRDLS